MGLFSRPFPNMAEVNCFTYKKCQKKKKKTRGKRGMKTLTWNSRLLRKLMSSFFFFFKSLKYSLMQLPLLPSFRKLWNKMTSILPEFCLIFHLRVNSFSFDSKKQKQSGQGCNHLSHCSLQRLWVPGPFSCEMKSLATKSTRSFPNKPCCHQSLE